MSEPMSGKYARKEHDDFMAKFAKTLEDAMALKRVMIAKGLTKAKAKCKVCEGFNQGRLVGRKNHMRFWCDGTCKRELME